VDKEGAPVAYAIKLSSQSTLEAIGMALTSLLDSVMSEKTLEAVATNIGDINEAVGGWDLISSP